MFTKSHKSISVYILYFYLGVLFLMLPTTSIGQTKFWIEFTDKGNTSHILPQDILSPRAIANRVRQGISLDIHDYPVNTQYVQELKMIGITPIHTSKWINGISAYLNPSQIDMILQLPFVKRLQRVGGTYVADNEMAPISCDTLPFQGTFMHQLNMTGTDTLHMEGFTGKGVVIAVFDNGFLGVDQASGFQHLFENEQIIATWDYVEGDEDVYGPCSHCRHGTETLSAIAANDPEQIMGAAPDAEFILLKTENDSSETHQEEDNWVVAAEFADSLGAHIFSTSLGYFNGFTNGEVGYTLEDLDGNTAIITRAADIAASKGILVVNSAGNSGERGLVAPADGDSVIAVGAVNDCRQVAGFSSRGFSADGRIKPDVTTLGSRVYVINASDRVSRASGTSFSCPLISGLMACIIQAFPGANSSQMYDALIRAADRFEVPDREYGYGIPSSSHMRVFLGEILSNNEDLITPSKRFSLFPNPSSGTFFLTSFHTTSQSNLVFSLYSLEGRLVYKHQLSNVAPLVTKEISVNLPNGIYYYRINPLHTPSDVVQGKLVINTTFEP